MALGEGVKRNLGAHIDCVNFLRQPWIVLRSTGLFDLLRVASGAGDRNILVMHPTADPHQQHWNPSWTSKHSGGYCWGFHCSIGSLP
jgi:hypothetical protein